MKFKSHSLALAALMVASLVPAAGASPAGPRCYHGPGSAYGAYCAAAPAAPAAGPNNHRPDCYTNHSPSAAASGYCPAASATAYSPGAHDVGITHAPAAVTASAKERNDFAWGDAGVGAGAGAGLAIVVLGGGAFLLGRRRRHEPSPIG